jgi:hypothetical protein
MLEMIVSIVVDLYSLQRWSSPWGADEFAALAPNPPVSVDAVIGTGTKSSVITSISVSKESNKSLGGLGSSHALV